MVLDNVIVDVWMCINDEQYGVAEGISERVATSRLTTRHWTSLIISRGSTGIVAAKVGRSIPKMPRTRISFILRKGSRFLTRRTHT